MVFTVIRVFPVNLGTRGQLQTQIINDSLIGNKQVPRFTGKTRITGKTAEILERPKNNRELKFAVHLVMY